MLLVMLIDGEDFKVDVLSRPQWGTDGIADENGPREDDEHAAFDERELQFNDYKHFNGSMNCVKFMSVSF